MEIYQNGLSQLQIDSIKVDEELMFRENLNEDAVNRYTERYKEGLYMPPITVYDVKSIGRLLVDGFHRLTAAKKAGLKYIDANFRPASYDDAFVDAIKANAEHGIPLSIKEKRKAITKYLKKFPERADKWIAEDVGVSKNTVAKIREELEAGCQIDTLNKFRGRDGKWYPRTVKHLSKSKAKDNTDKVKVKLEDLEETSDSMVKTLKEFLPPENDKKQEDSKVEEEKRLHKIEEPPGPRIRIRGDVLPDEWDPDYEKEKNELHREKIKDLINEGCEPIDESKIEDDMTRTAAHLINLSFEDMGWDDDKYENIFDFEDGRAFLITIKELKRNKENMEEDKSFEGLGSSANFANQEQDFFEEEEIEEEVF